MGTPVALEGSSGVAAELGTLITSLPTADQGRFSLSFSLSPFDVIFFIKVTQCWYAPWMMSRACNFCASISASTVQLWLFLQLANIFLHPLIFSCLDFQKLFSASQSPCFLIYAEYSCHLPFHMYAKSHNDISYILSNSFCSCLLILRLRTVHKQTCAHPF